MFIVRKEQAEAYRVPMLEDFEARAAQYLRKCLAKTTARYTDQQLRQRVRECLPRARRYGLTSEAGIVCFVAATFLLEEDFDGRRQFLPAQILLRSPQLDPKTKGDALLLFARSMAASRRGVDRTSPGDQAVAHGDSPHGGIGRA